MKGIRPELANHPLTVAAREVNDYAETHGLNDTCEHYQLGTDDVHYIAEQRALRCLWAFRGKNLNLKENHILMLSPEDNDLLVKLVTAYMDGLVIGWRGREIKETT